MTTNQPKAFEKQMPAEIDGMVTISCAAFFATMGPLDVHPEIASGWDRVFGYRQNWRLRSREMIGASVGGTCFSHSRYMVTTQFFNNHRAAIAAAG